MTLLGIFLGQSHQALDNGNQIAQPRVPQFQQSLRPASHPSTISDRKLLFEGAIKADVKYQFVIDTPSLQQAGWSPRN